MPEGDTIHHAANRIRPVLEGKIPDAIQTPHPRFGRDRWPERLKGQAVTGVDAHDLGNDVWTSAELLDWAKGRRARR